jgi:type I restriction-modification system DNA methylase subunit
MQHLKPFGRAGIVVPEGIIFGRDANYKELRKRLCETDLVGVISLPAGIFYPYSSNKTSILIIDRETNKKRNDIFFCKIKNDGFSLTTNREPLDETDLPDVLRDINSWFEEKTTQNLISISKSSILGHKDVSLDLKSLIGGSGVEGKFQYVQISDVTSMVKRGITPKYSEEGITVINQKCIRNHSIDLSLARKHNPEKTFKNEKFLKNGDVLINSTGVGTLGRVAQYIGEDDVATVDSHVTIVRPDSESFDLEYFGLAVIGLEDEIAESGHGSTGQTELSRTVVEEMFIPMPDIHEQKEIVKQVHQFRSAINNKQNEIQELEAQMTATISSLYL